MLHKMIQHLVPGCNRMSLAIFRPVLFNLSNFKSSHFNVSSSSSCSFSSTFNHIDSLHRLNHKDWLSPNEVIEIFKNLKDPHSVITVLEKLSKRKDYKPNEALYTQVIQKLAQARNFDAIGDILTRIKTENFRLSDDFFYGVIKIYGNVACHIDKAIETLFGMPEFNCWPTIRTFNLVLNLLISAKQFDVVHEVYLGASQLGLTVDACCLNILIKGLCNCGEFAAAFALLDEFPKQGCSPNVRTYSTLMHYLFEKDRVDEAFELCERMEREGCEPDTITFNILISGLCKQGRVEEGMELLNRMMGKGCDPNSGSYQAVLYGLLSSKKFMEAKCFMDRMVSQGVIPSFQSYKLVIHGLCDENLLEDVDLVLKQMVLGGFVPRMGMWKKMVQSMFLRKNSLSCISYSQIVGE